MCLNFFKKNKKANAEPVIDRPVEASSEVEEPENYSFKLTVEDTTRAGKSKTVYDPSVIELVDAVNTLKLSENNFLVLESKKPINNCTFIQSTGFQSDEISAYAEVQRIESENGHGILRNYGKTVRIETLKEILKAFTENSTPSIGSWDHIMDFEME